MPEFRVGIVGLGRCGETHRDAWRSLGDGIKVQSICDESLGVTMRATHSGLAAYSDPQTMIEYEKLDAVSICTPPASHPELAELFLRHGIPVLCEKPLATNLAAAFRLFDIAHSTGTPFGLATKFRLVPEVRQARELVAAGEIGEILTFRVEFASNVNMATRWNCLPEISGGGVIIDNGCHAFDLVQYLLGPIGRLRTIRLLQSQPFEVEDSAVVMATAGDNILGEVFLSWSLFTGSPNYVTICGTRGTIEIGWQKSTITRPGEEPEVFGDAYDNNAAHRLMVKAFHQALHHHEPLWITPDEAIETAFAVEAAYRSLANNSSVEMAVTRVRNLGQSNA